MVKILLNLWHRANEQPKRLLHWYVLGTRSTPPPDLFKQRLAKKLGRDFGLKVFVETGTYHGDMTAAASRVFDQVYSIELHKPFYDKAKVRFANEPKVKILPGDSGVVLRRLLSDITQPCLFWLDAHGGQSSKNTNGIEAPAPVKPELEAILQHPLADHHVILIDDVHAFVRSTKWGTGVWPQLEQLRAQWLAQHPDWIWKVKDNILVILKRRAGVLE